MAIPTQAEAKTASIAAEIAPYEKHITEYLEDAFTVAYLENPEVLDKVIIRTFVGKELTVPAIAALKASITAAGWTSVVVENQYTPAAVGLGISQGDKKPLVFVTFKAAASAPPVTTP